jgi:FAD/FMN-containing dehydrogenase
MSTSLARPASPFAADVTSWGNYPASRQVASGVEWRDQPLTIAEGLTTLPHGLGRSYGDSCLNDGGAVLLTEHLNRFIAFDRATGVLRCEAGVTLADILLLVVPLGWFLPVTPGTKFVTVGGAIANDVHGKNHHRVGTFGRFVRAFELVRSDGTRRICTSAENPDWFRATIGGLGLTGLVTWAEVQLKPIWNSAIEGESIKFGGLDEFYAINEESERDFEYTVAWVDCLSQGSALGRGHYLRGNHAGPQLDRPVPLKKARSLTFPFHLPSVAMSSPFMRLFNSLYYHRQFRKKKVGLQPFDPFFYPLDAILRWNRAYGKRGFFQYQFVVPVNESRAVVKEIFEIIAKSQQGSALAVLKTFGALESPGLLSFPRPGVTLALDFANRGQASLDLFERLDRIVETARGSVYPAKDARMSGKSFRTFFPAWERLVPFVDPKFSSSFWRRVTALSAGTP